MSHSGGALTFTSDSPEYIEFVRNRLSHVDALLRTPRSALYIEGLLDTVQNLVADSSPNAIRNTKNLNLFLQRFERVTADLKEFRCVLPLCIYVLVLVRTCSSRLSPPLASSPSASASGVHSPQRVVSKMTLLAYCFCSYSKICLCFCCLPLCCMPLMCACGCGTWLMRSLFVCLPSTCTFLNSCPARASNQLCFIYVSGTAASVLALVALSVSATVVSLSVHVSASAMRK